jgi:hypothetical protein
LRPRDGCVSWLVQTSTTASASKWPFFTIPLS